MKHGGSGSLLLSSLVGGVLWLDARRFGDVFGGYATICEGAFDTSLIIRKQLFEAIEVIRVGNAFLFLNIADDSGRNASPVSPLERLRALDLD